MFRKSTLLIIVLLIISLVGCRGEAVKAPRIYGGHDFIFRINQGSHDQLDLLKNVKAKDEVDGDITDKITFTLANDITEESIESIYEIDFAVHSRFRVIYSVTNSNNVKSQAIQFIIIGDPNSLVIKYADKDGCLAKNYTYDHFEINKDYKLVWSDEFDKDGTPSTKYWRYDLGGGGYGNGEKQNYTNDPKNVVIKDGSLVITALLEEKDGSNYTSARIMTTEDASFMYGKWEVRARLPKGKGTWPAIWMLPAGSFSWPDDGEIDIMETAYYMQNSVISTVHTKAYNHLINTQVGSRKNGGAEIYTEFNIYSIEWLPDKIIGYFNNEPYFVFEPQLKVTCPTYSEWPFLQDFRLIMNIAMGGGMGQEIDDNIFQNDISMNIDYVRIYQSNIIKNLKPQ